MPTITTFADECLDEDPLLQRHSQRVIHDDSNQLGTTDEKNDGDGVDDHDDHDDDLVYDDDDDDPGECCDYAQNRIMAMLRQGHPLPQRILQQYKTGYQQYTRDKLRQDVVAGCTVAIMVIPLSMSYAKMAGLPAYYGLYASFVPPFVFPTLSTSRQLAVGPAALVCLLLSSGLSKIVEENEGLQENSKEYMNRYITLAIQCSFLVGIMYIAMGLLQMGFVTQFLSRPLISGFTSGAAVIIMVSQVKYIFGYDVQSSVRLHELITALVENIDHFNWKTFVLGVFGVAIVLGCKEVGYLYPKYSWFQALGPFAVASTSILLTVLLDLDKKDVPTVHQIPPGLPSISVQLWTPLSMDLWVLSLSIVVVGFVQAFAISKRFAYKHGYELDSSQELLALGLANLVGGVFRSFPVTGALGQSAVNDSIGAQTGVASCVTAAFVMIALLFLTPVFEKMPLAALGAIVIAYAGSMFDYPEAMYLYRVHKFDFSVWMVAFVGATFLGVTYGLAIAVGLSLLLVVYEAAYPHTSVLGRLRGTSLYRNVKQYKNTERYDGLVIIRINSPIFFANAVSIRDKVRKYKRTAEKELESRNAGNVNYIILDLSPVSHVDTTALHVLEDMYVTQKKLGTQICFTNPSISVMEKFIKSNILDTVGREHFFSSDVEAVRWCLTELELQGTSSSEHE